MTKKEHIEYWKISAEKDWDVVFNLYKSEDYVYCLFLSHLVIEKLSKAIWVKDNNGNHLPRLHNIVSILSRTDFKLDDENTEFLLILTDLSV